MRSDVLGLPAQRETPLPGEMNSDAMRDQDEAANFLPNGLLLGNTTI
jgi:hypothetical protein